MRIVIPILSFIVVVAANDFGRDVSMKSGFENTDNDLKTEQNIRFIKRAAIAKSKYGKRSAGIYTKNGEQTVGSTILNNSKVLNVYNYSDIKGPVVNINKK